MSFTKILSFLACIQPILFFTSTSAATFDITNRCAYTVWAAASPGGGRRLDSGQSWQINVPPGTTQGRIWGRTNCIFDGNGQGRCQTGDCNGELQCQGYGQGPNTMAEFAINQANHLDFMDISLVDGFNIPMEFGPTTDVCRNLRCTVQINDQCPNELRAPGGCNNPCSLYNTSDYCCTNGSEICGSTTLSRFFKERCPDAYSYPLDDQISTFTCPAGTNYKVVFCGGRTFTSFTVTNLCSYTVWAAAFPGGNYGGKRLDPGQSSQISFASGVQARIWGRTNCSFNGSGRGRCLTGDCNGRLNCQGYGQPPNTLAEFALNQFQNLDFIKISLVDGFNIPMEFSPTTNACLNLSCTAPINDQCPNELRAPGGCNNPCTVFRTNEYCCTYGTGSCGPTTFSRFFKDRCPSANSYPLDDTSTAASGCTAGTNYNVVFCPTGHRHGTRTQIQTPQRNGIGQFLRYKDANMVWTR